jgi:hypothetical protein
LLRKAKRRYKAGIIRSYLDEFERRQSMANEITAKANDYITWARKKADCYDLFIESDDELFKEVDREKLNFKKKSYSW